MSTTPNPFFNWSFDVAPGSSNRSQPVENEFAAIGTGFSGVWAVLQTTLRAPTGDVLGLLPNRESRKGKSLAFDGDGEPIAVVAATSAEMAAAIVAATTATTKAAEAVAAAASVSNASSYIQQLMLVQGVK